MITIDPKIFKAYDIRGIYGQSVDEEASGKIGRAFAKYLNFPKKVIVACDGRVSSPTMKAALIDGLVKVGVNIIDIDLASTDMFYYACKKFDLPGITVTASHNPKEYTGFKMVEKIPKLLSGDDGIKAIRQYIEEDSLPADAAVPGTVTTASVIEEFVDFALGLIDTTAIKPMKVFADTANGMVGPILQLISQKLPQISFVPMYWEIDGNFPNHGGDPLEAENRREIESRIIKEGGDLGVMFDPDGDRFFAIDAKGRFITGDFTTAIFSEYFLKKYPGCGILYDIRASKVVADTITRLGGHAFAGRVGHTYIKARMDKDGLFFSGEVSGHYFFKDFYLCDSGTISFVYFLDFLSKSSQPLTSIIDNLLAQYHISGEINSEVKDIASVLAKIESIYGPHVVAPIERMDGITLEMGDWRFNVRSSNTQPLLRLCLEAKTQELMEQKRDEILALIRA